MDYSSSDGDDNYKVVSEPESEPPVYVSSSNISRIATWLTYLQTARS